MTRNTKNYYINPIKVLCYNKCDYQGEKHEYYIGEYVYDIGYRKYELIKFRSIKIPERYIIKIYDEKDNKKNNLIATYKSDIKCIPDEIYNKMSYMDITKEPRENDVIIYTNCNYEGIYTALEEGKHMDYTFFTFKSIKIPSGYTVNLYNIIEQDIFKGLYYTLTSSNSCLDTNIIMQITGIEIIKNSNKEYVKESVKKPEEQITESTEQSNFNTYNVIEKEPVIISLIIYLSSLLFILFALIIIFLVKSIRY